MRWLPAALASWSVRRRITCGVVFGLLLALALLRAFKDQAGGDFQVFWHAGHNFFTGQPLYEAVPGERAFIYPPFAAMVFQVLALFPLQWAAALFNGMNVALVGMCVFLTWEIMDRLDPDRNKAAWPLVLAAVLSGQLVIDNLNLVQSNQVIFMLCLLGVKWTLERREGLGVAAFVVATFMKIVPVFFLCWVVIRGRYRAALWTVFLVTMAFAAPFILRGPTQGAQDLVDYHATFLSKFQQGGVVEDYTNQNMAALVQRMVRPSHNRERLNYRIFPLDEGSANLLYQGAFLVVLGAFFATLVARRLRSAPVSAFEVSSVFLAGHLLSGITWKSHLVTLVFVLYVFWSMQPLTVAPALKWYRRGILGMSVVVGLAGRDIVGYKIHHYLGGYSVITWMMIGLLGGCLVLAYPTKAPRRPQLVPAD